MKKRFLSVVLCLCIVAGMMPVILPVAQASTNGHTRDEAVSWANSRLGQGAGLQCVQLIRQYYEYLGQPLPTGNAADYQYDGGNRRPSGWTRYTNSQTTPQPGDVVVFCAYYNNGLQDKLGYGHVGIVVAANNTNYSFVDYNGPGSNQPFSLPNNAFTCVIRPDWTSTPVNVSVNWGDYYQHSISTTSPVATLARRATISGASVSSAQCGIYLYNSSGTLVASKREGVAPENGIVNMWYDVTGELGYSLTAGASYTYKFVLSFNGKDYYSPTYSFVAGGAPSYSILAITTGGGTVTGGGSYTKGTSITVKATPNSGYTFMYWVDGGGTMVSGNASYTFTVNADRTLAAVFTKSTPATYTITVNATTGGTVTGGGSYEAGKTATVKATANSGYTFKGWTENGSTVSTSASYTFTVSASRTLTAVFEKAGAVAPTVTVWPTAAAVNYGQTLVSSALSGGKASVSGTFKWNDSSVTPKTGQSYDVTFTPSDTTKYSAISGKVSVTVNKSTPALSVSAFQSGTSVMVNTSASNPYNTSLTDVPTPTVTYRIGNGAAQRVTGSSFTIPEGTASGTVITITASTAESGNYRAVEKSTTLTVASTTSGTSYHVLTTSGSDLGGSVSIQPASAKQGETVTVIATPRSGYRLVAVTATDASGAAVRLTSLSGGRYTFTMPDGNVTLDAVFEATQDVWVNPFSDIVEGAWYYDAVKFVSQNGLMNGSDGVFNHSGNLSRAMIAQILYNKEGKPATSGGQSFSDVPGNMWYANAISWAANSKLIFGDEKGLFSPNAPITREQLALILWRYEGSPTSSGGALNFTDAGRISSYAREAVSWAVANGIISGKGGGVLDPLGPATRAQVAQMLKNYFGS